MPLGHLGVNVADLSRAKNFYDAIMPLLAFEPFFDTETEFSYRPANGKVGTWIFFYKALEEGEYSPSHSPATGTAESSRANRAALYSPHRPGLQHLAFMVDTQQAVREVHAAALELGSSTIYEPQEFPQYHEGYYAAFFRDPDGFMVEVVCHRDKSA